MVDSSCNIHKINLATRPIQEEEPWATTTSLARVMTEDRAVEGPPAAVVVLKRAAEAAVAVVLKESIFFCNHEDEDLAHTGRRGEVQAAWAHDADLDADWVARRREDKMLGRFM